MLGVSEGHGVEKAPELSSRLTGPPTCLPCVPPPPNRAWSTNKITWSGLPFPSPGDLSNPGIKPRSPALQADSLLSKPLGKPHLTRWREKSIGTTMQATTNAGVLLELRTGEWDQQHLGCC